MEKKWLWIAGAGVVALVLFILLDPGPDQRDKEEAVLWTDDFREIEYIPGKSEIVSAAKSRTDSAKDGDKKATPFNPDEVRGKFHFRIIREPGLYEDTLYVETPRGGRPEAALIRHRGNLTVRNIFRDWNKPKYKAVYDRRAARELDRDFDGQGPRLLLFRSAGSEPVTVEIGRKMDNGHTVVRVSSDAESVYLLSSVMFNHFEYPYYNYRQKRILDFPTDSYSREITIRREDGKEITLRQKREKKDDKFESRWFSPEGFEISLNNANQIDNYVKQIQIDRFADESDTPARGDLEKLWDEAARDDYFVRVAIEGGKETTFQLRGGAEAFAERLKTTDEEKTKTGEESLLLLRSSSTDGTTLTVGRHARNLKNKMNMVLAEIETKKRDEARKASGGPGPK